MRVIAGVVGVVGILGVWLFRENMQALSTAAVELSPDEVLRLGGKARGPMPEVPYVARDLARVAAFGSAQQLDGQWRGLPSGTVLRVASTTMEGSGLWVSGIVQGGTARNPSGFTRLFSKGTRRWRWPIRSNFPTFG